MSSVRGSETIKGINKRLARLKVEVAQQIAREAAGQISAMARASYDAGMTCYNEARPTGKHGALSLVDSGFTEGAIGFTSDGGTKIRCMLGRSYCKYLVGKYRILPMGMIPLAWSDAIAEITIRILRPLVQGGA